MIEILPTCVSRNAEELLENLKAASALSAWVHVDVDDGIFAPHLTWPYTAPGIFSSADIGPLEGANIEVHLMVEEPKTIGEAFARAGASRIIAHVEGFADAEEVRAALAAWRKAGAKEAGLALLLQTPLEVVAPLVAACDVVHLMSIASIGVQGIAYEESAPARVAEFHARFPGTLISVDGGVSEKNIAQLVRAGARRFGVGSALAKAENPQVAYENLKNLAESVVS